MNPQGRIHDITITKQNTKKMCTYDIYCIAELVNSNRFMDAELLLESVTYSISQEICTRFFALLCFVVVIHWLIFPYPSGLLPWHCGNLTIAPVPAKQPWWICINTSCEFIMNDCITTTKQSTTKPCAYFLGYTVHCGSEHLEQWGSNQNTHSFRLFERKNVLKGLRQNHFQASISRSWPLMSLSSTSKNLNHFHHFIFENC